MEFDAAESQRLVSVAKVLGSFVVLGCTVNFFFVCTTLIAAAANTVFAVGAITLSITDIASHRLPRIGTYTTLSMGYSLLVLDALCESEKWRVVSSIIGGIFALGFMLLLFLHSNGGLGDGDVRFSPLLGVWLGWWGLPHVVVGFLLGFIVAGVFVLLGVALGRLGRGSVIPFGPFLTAGAVATILFIT